MLPLAFDQKKQLSLKSKEKTHFASSLIWSILHVRKRFEK